MNVTKRGQISRSLTEFVTDEHSHNIIERCVSMVNLPYEKAHDLIASSPE